MHEAYPPPSTSVRLALLNAAAEAGDSGAVLATEASLLLLPAQSAADAVSSIVAAGSILRGLLDSGMVGSDAELVALAARLLATGRVGLPPLTRPAATFYSLPPAAGR